MKTIPQPAVFRASMTQLFLLSLIGAAVPELEEELGKAGF
jgi:hypothetical protein